MTPSSDKNSSLDHKNKNDLLNAIGNPNATEEEWLAACEKLGEHPLPKPRKKNAEVVIGLCALGSVMVGSCVYKGVTIAAYNASIYKQEEKVDAAAASIDYGPYMASLQRRIKRAWFPPKGNESKRVKVRFKMHQDGTEDGLKIWNSSGIAACDAAALRAVENANPFKPLPAGSPENVDIEFTFDYNVFKHDKSN